MFALKWGKESYQVTIDSTTTPTSLKAQIEILTGVLPANQKLSSKKGGWKGILADTTKFKMKPGKTTLSLMGSVAATIQEASKSQILHSSKQQLFEEDVRTAVRRSAEKRIYSQKKQKKEEELKQLRTKTFMETCQEEEIEGKKRKERLITVGHLRKMATTIHNDLQTDYANWICPECTVTNVASERKCHVCKTTRRSGGPTPNSSYEPSSYYRGGMRGHQTTVVLDPIVSLFGLEGFSGTVDVCAIRAMVGSRYNLNNRHATFTYLPQVLEGVTLVGSRGSVCDGDVEAAFAASETSRVWVGISTEVILRGVPEWLNNDMYERIEQDIILMDDGTHYMLYKSKTILNRGDVFECLALRSWSENNEKRKERESLCLWFVEGVATVDGESK